MKQHARDPTSILADLVKRYTRRQVFEVADGMVVEPNCAYIIPSNRNMAFLNGALQLLEPVSPRGQRLPIDFFSRSLAQDRHASKDRAERYISLFCPIRSKRVISATVTPRLEIIYNAV